MFKIIMIIMMSVTYSFANVQSGDEVSSVEYNNSKFNIGDIKHSILTLAEFQTLHGSCWIKLNQGADNSDIDITGSDLANLKSVNSIKSATGRVLRAEGGLSNSLGQTQEDELKSHRHRLSENSGSSGDGPAIDSFPGSASTNSSAYTQYTGGDETRMKNLTVNMFIKINNNCN